MAIIRKVETKDKTGAPQVTQLRVVDFSYAPNDSLAQMIVDAWVDKDFRTLLLTRGADGKSPNAKAAFAARGLYLNNPVVITEDEYYQDHEMQDDQVVFVLPDSRRAQQPGSLGLPSHSLLETARLLMASTPHGI
jgi:hypothetical protein